ncbi:MAG: RagB/SusD family nutrient uptake outer membrane protein [Dysgonamonadaceae bacterium]|jgi:hypothetical protein|nr:RagB/SusD family nutrient uptake outer membrane protein [Dysgonamonadaceae bacterium]
MKRFIILAIIMLTVGLSACDNLLDTKPLDKISEKDYFKTEGDLQLFSNPFYNNLLNKSPFNEQSDLLVQLTLSDILQGGNKRTVPNSGGGWTWTDLRRMNTLLEYADQCEDEQAVTKYKALTKFFRAYFYFEKVKRFGDVPWYGQQLGSADEELYNPRDSRELVMTKMIEDVDEAIANLSSDVSTYRANKWAALALKAQFCLYEGTYRKYHGISLEGHDYQYYLDLAAKAAKTLIDGSPYKLYTTGNPKKDYLTLFAQENASTDEYILAIKFDYGLGIYHNATAYTLVPTQGRPGYTKNMVDQYLMSDGTAFTDQVGWESMPFADEVKNRDPRLAQSIRTPGYTRIGKTEVLASDLGVTVTGYQPIKFVQDPTASGGNVDRNDRSTCDLPVYRYAEVLLNYAEAKAELGTLTQADLDLSVNKIRARAGMPNLSIGVAADRYLKEMYPNVSSGIILEIRRERAVELVQEGFRLTDLMRWKAGSCIDRDLIGMYFPGPGSYDLSGDGNTDLILYEDAKPSAPAGVQVYKIGEEILLTNGNKGNLDFHKNVERTKFNEVRDYLYPIPINERSLNKNLTQNPGWNDGLNF